MRFDINEAAKIAYGHVPDAGKKIQGECVRHLEEQESYAKRRADAYNAAHSYAHIEAGDEFFTEAMENARDLMQNMMSAYQAFDYEELGIMLGCALMRQQALLAERETVRIMGE